MYNICFLDEGSRDMADLFSSKYDMTDDLSQANAVITGGAPVTDYMIDSKLVFAVIDLSSGKASIPIDTCSDRGIAVFSSGGSSYEAAVKSACSYIESGNISVSANYPEVSLEHYADEASRISLVMKGIEDPILLGAMMFSGMDVRAVSGGIRNEYGAALVVLREPVVRVPHVEGVLKVRVLQDI